jgi:hypothetical protein
VLASAFADASFYDVPAQKVHARAGGHIPGVSQCVVQMVHGSDASHRRQRTLRDEIDHWSVFVGMDVHTLHRVYLNAERHASSRHTLVVVAAALLAEVLPPPPLMDDVVAAMRAGRPWTPLASSLDRVDGFPCASCGIVCSTKRSALLHCRHGASGLAAVKKRSFGCLR